MRTPPAKLAKAREYRETNRALLRQRQRANLAWLHSFKEKPCVDCKGRFPTWCMDFDHVRGTKFIGIGRLVGAEEERVLREIAKCDLVCACCHRIRTSQRIDRSEIAPRRLQFLSKLNVLKGSPCQDCGRVFPPEAMDFDHVEGEKVINVSLMTTWAWSKVLIEVGKCALVCACCHRTRTQKRLPQRFNVTSSPATVSLQM